MRLFGLMVTKNEAGRFLAPVIESILPTLDALMVFDDQSTDETVKIAQRLGGTVMVRGDHIPSFMEHEGRFRQAALDAASEVLMLQRGDWVLVIDADEFLTSKSDNVRYFISEAIAQALEGQARAVRIPIWSVWGGEMLDQHLMRPDVRMDGWWGQLREPRLWQWHPEARFSNKPMGCRNEPTYVWQHPIVDSESLDLLHYGYAFQADRDERYRRYTSLKNHGHSDEFINSIRRRKMKVQAWDGKYVPVRSPR